MSSACRKEARAKVIRAVVGQLAWQGFGHLCHLCCDFCHCLQEAPRGDAARGLARGYEENNRYGNGWFLTLRPRKERMPRTRAGKDSSTEEWLSPGPCPGQREKKGEGSGSWAPGGPSSSQFIGLLPFPAPQAPSSLSLGVSLLAGLPALPLLYNPPPNNRLFPTTPD